MKIQQELFNPSGFNHGNTSKNVPTLLLTERWQLCWEPKQYKVLFPKKSDREQLVELLKIVNSDADDKAKKAELAEKIGKVGGRL